MQWNAAQVSSFLSNHVWERETFLIKRYLLAAAFFCENPFYLNAHLCSRWTAFQCDIHCRSAAHNSRNESFPLNYIYCTEWGVLSVARF